MNTRLKQSSQEKKTFLGELHMRLQQKYFEPIVLGLTISKKERKKKKHTYIAYGQLHAHVSFKLTEGFHFYFYICLKS